jgi:hydrogenase maturation protease
LNICVLGIGNILLSDDGVGVHVINRLNKEYKFPKSIRLIDGGTKGLDLLPFFEGNDRVLIIDAVDFKKEPGTIHIIDGEKVKGFLSSKLSVHQIGLPDMLLAAQLMGIAPSRVCLIGIQPKSTETGIELSDEVKAQMGLLVEKVIQKLREWGIEVIPKTSNHDLSLTS